MPLANSPALTRKKLAANRANVQPNWKRAGELEGRLVAGLALRKNIRSKPKTPLKINTAKKQSRQVIDNECLVLSKPSSF
jgi:hypothetical protein